MGGEVIILNANTVSEIQPDTVEQQSMAVKIALDI